MRHREKIKKFIGDYKFNSLFFKNFFLILFLIMVPLLGATMLSYYAYSSMKEKDIRTYSGQKVSDVYADMERVLKEARTQLIHIGYNPSVELFMYKKEEIQELNYRLQNIYDLLLMPVISKEYINKIYLYSETNNKVITTDGIMDYDNFPEKSCFEQYRNGPGEAEQVMTTTRKEGPVIKKQLSLFRRINYGSSYHGVALMNLDLKALNQEFGISQGESVFLTDGNSILYSNHEELVGEPVSEIPGIGYAEKNGCYIGEDYSITHKKAEDMELELLVYLGLEGYQDESSAVKSAMFLFLGIMAVITFGLSMVISVRIFRPIEAIVTAIHNNRDVLMGEKEVMKEKDELEYILHSIRTSASSRQDVNKELAERVKLLKKAQAVALQSQINPHFLNNTLDTINWMAIGLLGGKNEISEMTGALSKMLRMSLENTDTIIPMSQEIEHCMYYLEIQSKRYEDMFRVVWKVPEEIFYCKSIRVILQPIVENAIYHGMKHLSNKGLITIGGNVYDEIIEVTVEDNGLGMTPQELEKLRENMRSHIIKESRHIGVSNVNQRIKLYFGDEYGILVDSTEGVGTKVTLRLPKIKN